MHHCTAATPDLAFIDANNPQKALEQYPDSDWKSMSTNLSQVKAHLQGIADEINSKYRHDRYRVIIFSALYSLSDISANGYSVFLELSFQLTLH